MEERGREDSDALVNRSRDDDYQVVSSREVTEEDEVLLRENDTEESFLDEGAALPSDADLEDQEYWPANIQNHSGIRPSKYGGEEKEEIKRESRWKIDVDGGVLSTPRVADGWMYFGSLDNHVYAYEDTSLEIEDGEPLDRHRSFGQYSELSARADVSGPSQPEEAWSFETDDKVGSTPAVDGDSIYIGSYDGRTYKLDRFTGELQWSYDAGAPVNSSPALDETTVYFGSDDGSLNAVHRDDGTEKWTFATGNQVWSSPNVYDGRVYVGSYDTNFYAVDADTGEEIWRYEADNQFCASSPATVDGVVYAGSLDGNLYAFDAEDGSVVWSYFAGDSIVSSPVVATESVYIGSLNGDLHAVDVDSGEARWRYETEDTMYSTPEVYDGSVYAASSTTVYEIGVNSGELTGTHEVSGEIMSSPVKADGRLYVGTTDGYVYSF